MHCAENVHFLWKLRCRSSTSILGFLWFELQDTPRHEQVLAVQKTFFQGQRESFIRAQSKPLVDFKGLSKVSVGNFQRAMHEMIIRALNCGCGER